jgi:hypothetical protein
MLQVLCQILQTESLVDVQSWLVSASDSDKEKVKQLIDQAMKGLEQSGRINNEDSQYSSNGAINYENSNKNPNISTISEIESHLNK